MPLRQTQSMSKYRAVRTNGYASKREAKRAWELSLLLQAGAISNLREQAVFELLPADSGSGYVMPLRYIADFVYTENGHQVVEDCKGFKTDVYRIKKRLMRQLLGISVVEV